MSNSEDFSLSSSCDVEDNLGYLITVLKSYIEERVTIQHLIPEMPCMRNVYSQIYTNRNDGKQVAEIFFKHLREIDEPGKYQQLLSALENQNYSLVVDVIKNGKISSSDDENRRLIELFIKRVAEAITPDIMAEELLQRQLIAADEAEKIRKLNKTESSLDAALYLLNRMHCRKKTWYIEFLEVLWSMSHFNLVKDIDDKFYSQMRKDSTEDSRDSSFFHDSDIEAHFDRTLLTSQTEVPSFTSQSLPHGTSSLEQSITSSAPDANISTEATGLEVSSQLEHFHTAPQQRTLMEEILAQLMNISHQITLQTDSISKVSDRVSALERKMDQVLEKL
ncbi:hypothetical protein EGW08_011067 [Elysia chlorotica]|uniref:Caspase recruitment domain-containing protein n=1 Tax=Elysia chlorotica TaxID=188477 RepID=A0A3S1BDQ2_ELYCH|nr:hypothetical protein EGW08_011067 [Elysia chlorotica]